MGGGDGAMGDAYRGNYCFALMFHGYFYTPQEFSCLYAIYSVEFVPVCGVFYVFFEV